MSGLVTWVVSATPWEIEDHLIRGPTRLPLNIRGSSNPFATVLSKLRSQALQGAEQFSMRVTSKSPT
jgi:hypothetical protein